MPDKPLVRVDVSWQTAKALVLGGDSFLGSHFIGRVLGQQIEIWTTVNPKSEVVFPGGVNRVSFVDSWQEKLPEKIDYFIDFLNLPETVFLAKKHKARLLTVIDLEKNKESAEPAEKNLDWRILKTAFVYGPAKDGQESLTLINKVLFQAVFNQKITIPFSETGKINPLYIDDFCQFTEQFLFSPVFEKNQSLLVGEQVSWQEFLDFLEKKTQFTHGVEIDPDFILPEIDFSDAEKLFYDSSWKPEISWQDGLAKTIQFFFQKKEKGELEFPEGKKTVSLPKEAFLETKVVEDEEKKEEKKISETSIIDQDFWEQKITQLKTKKKRKKEEVKNKEKEEKKVVEEAVVIEESWQEREFKKEDEEIKEVQKEKEEKKSSRPKTALLKNVFFLIFVILSFVFGPWFLTLTNFCFGGWYFSQAVKSLAANRWQQAEILGEKSETFFSRGLVYLEKRPSLSFFRLGKLGGKGARVISQGAKLASLSRDLGKKIWQEQGELDSFKNELIIRQESFKRDLSLFEVELTGKLGFLPPSLTRKIFPWREKIDEGQLFLDKTARLLPFLDWFLGQETPRKFLILLQNNMELRPTGGFIGSFATINFSDGSLVDFNVADIYSIDGQLKGHVEPPLPIKDILGEENWYLRDSNWSPDFATSAEKAAWFFQKETGGQVDGVLTLNLEAAKKILSQIGEVYLVDFDEKINANNLFAKAEFYAETNFFPGSKQKASFLSSLGKEILVTVKNNPDLTWLPLGKALWESVEEKEMFLWFKNEAINQVLTTNNWDGGIRAIRAASENSIIDYLFPVEANLGINKANFFLRRTINLSVAIDSSGQINNLFQVHYENTAQSGEWPGGNYKNYFRLFLPLGTKIGKVSFFDPLAGRQASERIITQEEITQTQEKGKMAIAFLIEVPINSRRTVEIKYSRQEKIEKDTWQYLLYFQKQSGMGTTPVTILVSYPSEFNPLQVMPAATLTGQGLVFNQIFKKDIPVAIELSR